MLEVYTVMAFVDGDHGGNAAGVCLVNTPLDAMKMLSIAEQVNFSETVFIELLDARTVAMRYFTPVEEVDLCGHATLAGFHWLVQRGILSLGSYELVTRSHRLEVSIDANSIFMEQPAAVLTEIPLAHWNCIYELCDNIDRSQPLYSASTGIVDLMLPFRDGEALASFAPDFGKLAEVCSAIGVQGMHAYTPYTGNMTNQMSACTPLANAYWVRNFAPLLGIDEESATGTSNCALSGLLAHLGNEATDFCFYQGMWMASPSIIQTRRLVGGAYSVGGRCKVLESAPKRFEAL